MNAYLPEGTVGKSGGLRDFSSVKAGLEYAYAHGLILEAPVILCDRDMNLHLSLGHGIHAVMPREECEFTKNGEPPKDIAILTRVGKTVCFKIIRLEYDSRGELYATLSRREAQLECMLTYISNLKCGDVIAARVTHLESFGAFVDIGCGIVSLLSVDAISVSRISHPSARLKVGESIHCVVKSIDPDGRIYTSTRELLGTWEENASRFAEGQTVRGIVRSVESYGIFIELAPNLAGLAEYKEGVLKESSASVYIKSIIKEKMKIKLIIIDSQAAESIYTPMEYFTDVERVSHIDGWVYSPPGAKKLITSAF